MMKMLDYVKMANVRLAENLDRASGLVDPLVCAYRASECESIRIVASGSSRNASDCIRHYMQDMLGVQVCVVTPESFIDFDHVHPADAFNIAISQSGYSTNTIAALDFMRAIGLPCAALTANEGAPISSHADAVIDYGVGVESVDFVTMGVQVLIEYLALFSLYAARAAGTIDDEGLAKRLEEVSAAVSGNEGMLGVSQAFVAEHLLELSHPAPVMVVGNGPNFGVAEEAALKFCETMKYPAMYHEGEEFVHGPEMQVAPGYHVFIIDDPAGSERLANISSALACVTDGVYFLTSHPQGRAKEITIPPVPPLLSAIPNLVLFQYITASVTEARGCWDVHPYLEAVSSRMEVKAVGYEQSVKDLEKKAAAIYSDSAGIQLH